MKKKHVIILFFSLLLVFLIAINGIMLIMFYRGNENALDRKLEKAKQYREEKQYQEAIDVYKQILQEDNLNVSIYQNMAQTYKEMGEIKKAKDVLDKGYKLTQDESLADTGMIITWEESGREDEEIEWKDSAVEQAVRRMTGITDGDIMLSDIWELTDYYLYGQVIEDLGDLEQLPNILSLHMYECQIDNLDMLKKFDNLEELYLSDNEITDLAPLSKLRNLVWLDVSNNQIENLSALGKLRNLEHLDISNNPIVDIGALGELKNLTYLNVSNISITDLSVLGGMTQIEELYMHNTNVYDISFLADMEKLQRLDISYDYDIENFEPLGSLVNLEELDVSYTNFYDTECLNSMKQLTYLNILGVNLSDYKQLSQIKYVRKGY